MNTAARTLDRGSWFQGSLSKISCSRETIGLLLLISLVLISAFSVVYVKNFERRLFSELQLLEQQRDGLEVEWGQLLLEQSTWATPARVQRFARDELGMVLPDANRVIMVEVE